MVEVIFYKGKEQFYGNLIRWWTKSKYSHCELKIGGVCYGADAWTNSVRMKLWSEFNPNNWDIVTWDMDPVKARSVAAAELGKGYDWFGIVSFLIPLVHHAKSKWYCSEFCAHVLDIGVRPISPGSGKKSLQGLYELINH